jgi:hypothetical protein
MENIEMDVYVSKEATSVGPEAALTEGTLES